MPSQFALLLCALWLGTCLPAQDVKFGRDILPILSRNCFACHGPDEATRKAGLELHRREAILAKRALVPGDAIASEIMRRIEAHDKDRMPPPKSGKTLSKREVELIREWIDSGASWGKHWSFERIARPAVPPVRNHLWPRSDLDRFVLARLEREGLEPAKPADRATLIRRVTLDLTGLPPTPAEAQAFIDDRRADAYERRVDNLLARPTYGEHWTRMWLDLARFADTKGYEKDKSRTVWPYRDWLIRSFNSDLPFDLFTRDQLAGDLLEKPTRDQLIATAFHRNTLTNDEGGTDNEEFRVAAVKDRVDATAQIWMGLTMGCANCHTHKYDPISQREYYSFYAFFNQTQDADRHDDAPLLSLPTETQTKTLTRLDAELAKLRPQLDRDTSQLKSAQVEWEQSTDRSKLPKKIAKLLEIAPKQRNESQRRELRNRFRSTTPLLAKLRKSIKKLEQARRRVHIPRLPIMRELAPTKRRKTHVHVRGSFLSKGPEVAPAVPAAFGPLPAGAPANRLGVARWLTHPDNPLTARVTVNRWWAQFFGTGIVATLEDFGSQGAAPSHPRLLDWLAMEFIQKNYSMKQLCKTIVMSATYRQSSNATPDALVRDRFNRLLARGPSFRLSAEMIRDNALHIAGLLSSKMHGPSVMPPQPPGIWQSTYNAARWRPSAGEDRWRRGIYTFTKRTSGYPASLVFDAPTREVCSLRRIRTNTPLQALVTLNDPVYVEAAQSMARRLMAEGGDTTTTRIDYGFRLATARAPRREETTVLHRLYSGRLAHYRGNLSAARAIATEPLGPLPQDADLAEHAAFTVICNVLLNLDEVLVKR